MTADIRRDPVTGRVSVIAPGRASRPGASGPVEDELASCPFCPGHEHMTPPPTLVEPATGAWQLRVVPNRYPALERQEVVVHSPHHVRSIADLDDSAVDRIAAAWSARARAAAVEGFPYVHAIVNEGRASGSSLPHTHSQLIWLREPPPLVREEAAAEHVLAGETVFEIDGVVLQCVPAPRTGYEMVVAPASMEPRAFESPLLGPALRLASDAIRRLRRIAPDAAVNLWLHDGPWWHVEILPRLAVMGGIELGAGIYVSTVAPETAAAELRDAG